MQDKNLEIGAEFRRISVGELGVPESYHNYSVVNHLDRIRNAASEAMDSDSHSHLSLARRMALSVFTAFRKQSEQWNAGNPKVKALFDTLKIPQTSIRRILEVDVDEVHRQQTALGPRTGSQ